MNFIQLFINDPATAELDLNQEVDIALQYSIADIKDISKRNAAYSKTIVIPGTKNNNYWFGNLFDVNADFSQFNPNKKTMAKLLVNTETVMDGFLQLRKITKLNNTDFQGNLVNYECVIYNNAVDLMSVIGENSINLLDMSEFGHTFSATNIKASWTHTYEDGYVYPMFGKETTPNQYKPEFFYPAIFYRTILDQMVREAGFGWTGSLAQNEQFNHEVLSYVTDGRPKITEQEKEARSFYVGLSPSQNFSYRLGIYPSYFGTNYPIPYSATASTPGGIFIPTTGFTMSFAVESGASPQGDGNFFDGSENNWNSTLYYWDVKKTGKYGVSYNLSYYFQVMNMTPGYPLTPSGGLTVSNSLKHTLQYRLNTSSAWTEWDSVNYTAEMTGVIPVNGTASKHIVISRTTASQLDLPQGAQVRLTWKGVKVGNQHWAAPSGIAAYADVYIKHTSISGGNWIKNSVAITELQQNDFIQLARYLPDKIKQKDLLTDLIRRYNLFIQTDPNNPKMLIFDARPDFYERGTIVDWTDKKDYSSPDEIELLSDLQSKLTIWSYKPDTDDYNKEFQEITGDVYGWYKYFFDNDFVKGENKIESSFSPTPIIKTPFNALVPAIDPETPKVQPRIFYWGGLRDCDGWSWTYTNPITGSTANSESFTTYPYAGHFDNPIEPQIDINFGTCKFYYYDDWTYITDNNMFNTYWSDYVRQIETGRLITSYFYLDEYDIRFIKDNFYTKIFILDSYYYVNKIVDYKPLMNNTTKVELIKIVDGVRWEPKKTAAFISPKPKPVLVSAVNGVQVAGTGNTTGGGGVVVGSGNTAGGVSIKGEKVSVFKYAIVGDNNVSSGTSQLLTGNNNRLVGDNSTIIGGDNNVAINGKSFIVGSDNNIVDEGADKSIIIGGEGNYISSTSSSILIGASGVTASTGLIYLGNSFIVDPVAGSFSSPFISSASASTYLSATPSLSAVLDAGKTGSSIQLENGSITSPSYTFQGDLDTGFYRKSANQIGVVANGTNSVTFDQFGIQLGATAGTGTYHIRFTRGGLTSNTGIYNPFGPELQFLSNSFTSLWLTNRQVLFNPSATFSLPAIAFSGDLDTGFIYAGSGEFGYSSNGATTSILGTNGVRVIEGSFATPSFSFINSLNTGLFRAVGNVGVTIEGATNSLFTPTQTQFRNGTVLEPSITFMSDTKSGLYRNAANQISISANGSTASTFTSTRITNERITYFNKDLVLYSPNGTPWQISVSNTGALTASALI